MSTINRSRVKTLALRLATQAGRNQFSRVSKGFLDRMERMLEQYVAAEVHRHPSVGKTLR